MSTEKIDSDINPSEVLGDVPQQLTVFTDPGIPEIVTAPPVNSSVMKSVPQDWMQRLQRPVFLGAYAWDSSQTTNAVVVAMKFPEALFTNENIQDTLKRVKFMRGKVAVSFRLNSTAFHYGLLQVAWLPCTDATTTTPLAGLNSQTFRNIYASSNNCWTLISANHRDTVEIEIPWQAPCEFIDLPNWSTTGLSVFPSLPGSAGIGSFVVRVVQPLHMANSIAATVQLAVHARFVDPEIAGYTEQLVSFSSANINYASSITTQGGESAEAMRMSKGPVSGVLERIAKFTAGLSLIPHPQIAAGSAAVSTTSKILASAFRSVGLSKPHTAQDPVAFNVVPSNLVNANGVCNFQKLSLLHESQVDESDKYVGDSSMLDLSEWHRRPALLDTGVFGATAATGDILYQRQVAPWTTPPPTSIGTPVTAFKIDPTYFNWYTAVHQYWRGSMKYKFVFNCSQFTTMRIAIIWQPEGSPVISNLLEGNVISRVVDIAGDTQVDFVIPQCSQRPWLRTALGYGNTYQGASKTFNGNIYVVVLNPIVSSGTTSSSDSDVYYTVLAAPGPDFQLARPTFLPRWVTVTPQASFVSDFGADFPMLNGGNYFVDKGVSMGDSTTNVLQLMKRMHYLRTMQLGSDAGTYASTNMLFNLTTAGSVSLVDPFSTTSTNITGNAGFNMLQYYAAPWLFARGGWRCKTLFPVGPPSGSTGTTTHAYLITYPSTPADPPNAAAAGPIPTASLLASQTELAGVPTHYVIGATAETGVEIPWYSSDYHWNPLPKGQLSGQAQKDAKLLSTATSSLVMAQLGSAADNFTLGTLCAPPALYYKNS